MSLCTQIGGRQVHTHLQLGLPAGKRRGFQLEHYNDDVLAPGHFGPHHGGSVDELLRLLRVGSLSSVRRAFQQAFGDEPAVEDDSSEASGFQAADEVGTLF